jgi:hypothetical protein
MKIYHLAYNLWLPRPLDEVFSFLPMCVIWKQSLRRG